MLTSGWRRACASVDGALLLVAARGLTTQSAGATCKRPDTVRLGGKRAFSQRRARCGASTA